ncbi:MAG: hypothetical protein WBW73_10025 [Rhodoplanes sp.]
MRDQAVREIAINAPIAFLIRYVESTRVPYEKDLGDIIKGGAPLELK